MVDEFNKIRLEELRKLKYFFKYCLDKNRKENQVAGSFGSLPSFFGNVIQYNSFEIPIKAMRIIYEHNKDRINEELKKNNYD